MIAHINIGSNLGDRAAHINAAIDLLGSTAGRVIAVSSPWHSGPWGYDSPNMFMNVGVNIDTDLSPTALLDTVKTAERTIDPDGRHRTAEGGYADRAIDIDIIAMGDQIRRSPDPQLPHPACTSGRSCSALWPRYCRSGATRCSEVSLRQNY